MHRTTPSSSFLAGLAPLIFFEMSLTNHYLSLAMSLLTWTFRVRT